MSFQNPAATPEFQNSFGTQESLRLQNSSGTQEQVFHPLLCDTQSPLCFCMFEYGGDYEFGKAEAKFGHNDPYITKVYETRRLFSEWIEREDYCSAISREFYKRICNEHTQQRNKVLERLGALTGSKFGVSEEQDRYRTKRKMLVEILGGEEKVKKIPFLFVDARTRGTSHITLSDIDRFVQFEDFAGRKGISFSIADAFGLKYIVTIHQRMRETSNEKGDVWVLNSTNSELSCANTEPAFTFLKSIINGTHKKYKLNE